MMIVTPFAKCFAYRPRSPALKSYSGSMSGSGVDLGDFFFFMVARREREGVQGKDDDKNELMSSWAPVEVTLEFVNAHKCHD